MSIEYVDASGQWAGRIRGAFNQVFGRTRSAVVWKHVYASCPDGSMGVAAIDANGTVLGHYGATIHRLGNNALVALARDAFTRPEARHLGASKKPVLAHLFARLCQAATEHGCDLIYGFSSERHFRLGAKILGYQPLGAGCYWRFDLAKPKGRPAQKFGSLVQVRQFSQDVDKLAASGGLDAVRKIRRDSRYLNWRFAPQYGGDYRLFIYNSFLADAPSGYFVIARNGLDWQLADWACPSNLELLRDSWYQLVDWVRNHGGHTITSFCSDLASVGGQLQSIGGEAYPDAKFGVLGYFPLNKQADAVRASDFALTLADMDAI